MSNQSLTTTGGCTPEQFTQVLQALHADAAAATALCQVFATSSRTEELAFGLNTVFMVLSGALVFIMHGGFAMLEAGAIRSKNAMNILLQTVLDGAASAVMWYLVGFGFAYGIGDNPNGFIGDALFGLARYSSHETGGAAEGDWTSWFFQWAFCATAATIPAGAVAERFNFNAYLGYSLFLGGFVYPVVAHWVWCRTGWLGYGNDKPLLGAGMIDFAGSGVVHMTGGLAGLIGAAMVGPRMGRFDPNGQPVHMPGHSAILVVLGTVLLWFGWYGFNPGSALVADTINSARVAGRAAVTTTLSGAAGGLACLALSVARQRSWDLLSLCNGMLVGFVAVTAGCAVVEPWAALLCGGAAAALFEAACSVLLAMRIDDVVSAGPMHGICGAWGVLFVGLLAKEEYVREVYDREVYPYGLFYGGGGKLLASQVIGVLAIAGWVAATMGPFFGIFKMAGALRITADDEAMGLDASKHGGSAYNIPMMQRYGGGFMDGIGAAANAAATVDYSNHVQARHQPISSYASMGGGGGKAVGDAIMRGNTIGGIGGITVGGGGSGVSGVAAAGAANGSSPIVAPFHGLSGILAAAALSSPASSPTGHLYGNRAGNGVGNGNDNGNGLDGSVESGVAQIWQSSSVRQRVPSVRTSASGRRAAEAAEAAAAAEEAAATASTPSGTAAAGSEISTFNIDAKTGGGGSATVAAGAEAASRAAAHSLEAEVGVRLSGLEDGAGDVSGGGGGCKPTLSPFDRLRVGGALESDRSPFQSTAGVETAVVTAATPPVTAATAAAAAAVAAGSGGGMWPRSQHQRRR